jgi:hypothetical protein
MGEFFITLIVEIFQWIFVQIIFDIFIKVPGYFIAILLLRLGVRKVDREISPDGCLSICCGLLFWAVVGGIGYRWYQSHK